MIFVFAAHRSQDIEHGADFPVECHSFTPSVGLILHLYLKYKYARRLLVPVPVQLLSAMFTPSTGLAGISAY